MPYVISKALKQLDRASVQRQSYAVAKYNAKCSKSAAENHADSLRLKCIFSTKDFVWIYTDKDKGLQGYYAKLNT
jgi:hypothetical protein